ncbi:MAG: alkaline-shock protein [Epulopiscium sp. Nuni2H_MBin003]|nr:MAG: alkaline-shock protein [Epulopiscium sp. Nuni2H_MBin003]
MDNIIEQTGCIKIDDDVIAQICGITAIECYGIVGMATRSMKDGIVRMLKRDNITKGVFVIKKQYVIDIEFHIIVEYGTKISAVTDNLISTVRYKLKDMLGIEVGVIKIFVEGVRVSM